mmetsp:Transcript_38117/g.91353  ORF Transcript_38117/g.91353 Transcript_38117/m.91353 type:complete len:205 (+) Transcript_38117:165-779(+)|eukprot:scaffold83891_cov93-Phaeocystis_antarctica.AAC.2
MVECAAAQKSRQATHGGAIDRATLAEWTGDKPRDRALLDNHRGAGLPGASQAKVRERGVVIGAAAEGPAVEPVGLGDGDVVDRRVADRHQALRVELPVLVAVGAMPLTVLRVVLVCKAHGDAVLCVRPVLLDESVVQLLSPLALEERLHRGAAGEDLVAVAPLGVLCVRGRHLRRVTAVPTILRCANLLDGLLQRERRQRQTKS